MKLSELHRIVNLYHDEEKQWNDPTVVIAIKLPYSTVGGQPTEPVKSASIGFDWDAGKFIIYTDRDLIPSDLEFTEQFTKLQEKCGKLEYENRDLKQKNKKLNTQLEQLNDSIISTPQGPCGGKTCGNCCASTSN